MTENNRTELSIQEPDKKTTLIRSAQKYLEKDIEKFEQPRRQEKLMKFSNDLMNIA